MRCVVKVEWGGTAAHLSNLFLTRLLKVLGLRVK